MTVLAVPTDGVRAGLELCICQPADLLAQGVEDFQLRSYCQSMIIVKPDSIKVYGAGNYHQWNQCQPVTTSAQIC